MEQGKIVLVTGATGFIGRRLVPELLRRGRRVRCLVRNPGVELPPGVEKAVGDLLRRETLDAAFAGVDAAYYLVHSLRSADGFEEKDRLAARNFVEAADAAALRRGIYLGGLGEGELSPHLASRREVGEILAGGSFRLTTLRAPVIIGHGGASYRIIRSLVARFPLIPAPRSVETLSQPIAVQDVIGYLAGVLEVAETAGKTYDICGPELLTYRDLIERVARAHGRAPLVIESSLVTGGMVNRLAGFLAPDQPAVSAALLPGLGNEVVCGERRIRQLIPIEPTPLDEALRVAREEEEKEAT
ncbi:MAG TPA: NAD(P)H-binding protein [Verrucomicrobiae bacterium]|nr:NAD(P)H-binding protein [Verrucomicrobiae bacterium]